MTETRQPEEQSTQPNTRINPVVFFGSAVCIIAIALWAIISPRAPVRPSGWWLGGSRKGSVGFTS